jgi:hypothetical protein
LPNTVYGAYKFPADLNSIFYQIWYLEFSSSRQAGEPALLVLELVQKVTAAKKNHGSQVTVLTKGRTLLLEKLGVTTSRKVFFW